MNCSKLLEVEEQGKEGAYYGGNVEDDADKCGDEQITGVPRIFSQNYAGTWEKTETVTKYSCTSKCLVN